ncbi:hypothetical protein VTK73DRAFT_3258 [Phialemonium thermophilum]|uniref:Uncharacterized protein n=1 Tax=Phialemonium thermophilum TaxID=223376 RepID=A0ABR3Y7J7_9PEZI
MMRRASTYRDDSCSKTINTQDQGRSRDQNADGNAARLSMVLTERVWTQSPVPHPLLPGENVSLPRTASVQCDMQEHWGKKKTRDGCKSVGKIDVSERIEAWLLELWAMS